MKLLEGSTPCAPMGKPRVRALFLAGLLAVVPLYEVETAPLARQADQGQALFQEKCVACHTIGAGDRVGPDLKGVSSRRDRTWLTRWLSVPDQMLAQGDPIAKELLEKYGNVPMPNQGLTKEQVEVLVAYLETEGEKGLATAAAATSVALPPGNAAAGKDLFTGVRRFRNGGPPCMACHSIAGIGALGGGALGPDLTTAISRFGGAGLASVLAAIPFPTMNPIYGRRPLTPQEQADLRAFVQQALVAERSPQAARQLTGLAIVGAAVLLVLAQLFWRRRLTGVRRALVSSQPSASSTQPAVKR